MNQELVISILDTYIPSPKIPLDHTHTPYRLLIAVLLSARCQDERVNLVTPHLFALAETPEQMSQLDVTTIQSIIRPCGLSQFKAQSIYRLSNDLIVHHQGKVPQILAELEKLPGIGHKTASVILAEAFGIPTFPVDTHIYRAARRWGLSQGTTVFRVESDLKKIFPQHGWRRLHLQILLFARKYCKAAPHNPAHCPMCCHIER
jgi:endonuclease-3